MEMRGFEFLTLTDSQNYTFGALVYLDGMDIRCLATGMAAAVIDVTYPRSRNYIDPVNAATNEWHNGRLHAIDVDHNVTNYWWVQVQFLHSITRQHKSKPFIEFDKSMKIVSQALRLAKQWRDAEIAEERRIHGENWGAASGWVKFDPTEYL